MEGDDEEFRDESRVRKLERLRKITCKWKTFLMTNSPSLPVEPVRYPTWISNPVLVKKVDDTWRMCIDFKNVNSACPKDYYPLPEINLKIEAVMGFPFKCFLDAYKGYHQIQMSEEDEDKTAFYTDQGTYCYTKMPFGLKNAGATYQRLVDSAFQAQLGRNLEAYVDDMVNMKLNPKKCSFGVKEGKFLGYMVTSEGIQANPKKTKAVADMQSPKTLKEMQSLSGKLAALNRFLSKSAERALPFFETLKNITKENKDDFRWTEEAEEAFQEMKRLIMELPTLTTPDLKETLYVYLAISKDAVSGVLMADRGRKQTPIRYVSRTLHEAERNYAPLEKLALCLLHLSRRLRRYFEAHPIKVITDQPIRQILNKPEVSEKLAKYAVELGAYNITYVPRNAVKGQVLADFLNEIPVGTKHMEICSLVGEENLEEWTLFTDGASNLKGAGAGLVLIDPAGIEYTYTIRLNFASTNNEAAYEALLAGLRIAEKMKVKALKVKVDSKLVACQLKGEFVASSEGMAKYLAKAKAKELTASFGKFSIENVPRNQNQKADVLKGIWPEDENEARTLRMKISQYALVEGVLFKRSYLSPMLSGKDHAARLLLAIHAPRYKGSGGQGLDILGPLQEGPGKLKFIIVAIDYFTKWMEAKPLAKTTGKEVKRFVWENIACRFGLPRVIVTDNGTQLVNDPFKSWCEKWKIKQMNTEVAHPQANGLVEWANKSLMHGLKARLGRERVGCLTYGSEAVIPAEIGMPTYRIIQFNEAQNEEEMRLNLDLIQERRETTAIREAKYKKKVEQYYNKRVRPMSFKVGDFVYRRNEASRVENQGKLGPNWEGPYRVIEAYDNGSYKLCNMNDREIPHTWHAINLRNCFM
ncbi:reverse transcriptase domain-containing protein [Tanacetum coccineum]|uniref:Reverse transcriptase domain-containing protein n=1 Tax=Tanacetum coccineum TaxID=301880 RepID=A0ABQ4Z873_9ASTR